VATSDPYDYEAMEEIQLAVEFAGGPVLAARDADSRGRSRNGTFPDAGREGKEQGSALKELTPPGTDVDQSLQNALIPLLIAKGIITHDELVRKAKERKGHGSDSGRGSSWNELSEVLTPHGRERRSAAPAS